jgi:NAD(P)-dependent dehydrogenase (short-subunit alcohol dehydrogenase family)
VVATVKRFGGIDILVNLASSYVDEGFASSREDWLESLNVNVASAVMMAKAVHLSCVSGGRCDRQLHLDFGEGRPDRALAVSGEQGGSGAADAQHGDGSGARRHPGQLVSPGWTWSRVMVELSGDDRAKTNEVSKSFHLLGRVGDPEEFANVVVFLCGDKATFATGADWAVDGGTRQWVLSRPSPQFPSLHSRRTQCARS